MWLGEKITERGIGNGISLIIMVGIVARLPNAIIMTVGNVFKGEMSIPTLLFILVVIIGVIAAVVFMQQGQRRIPVQYAKRVIGRRVYGGQGTHIPLRVNTAGVIPVIFASSVIMFPQTILAFIGGEGTWLEIIANWFRSGNPVYYFLYGLLIIFFTYFYTAIVLNPDDMADNMKRYGGFIPGIRPGKRTANYIEHILTRITLAGAIFLALIAILPEILIIVFNVPFRFGGTAILIVVGVALDTMRQIESHLMMRHYEGFTKRGRLRGRV
jgi:preprotein translocase subunit SecY